MSSWDVKAGFAQGWSLQTWSDSEDGRGCASSLERDAPSHLGWEPGLAWELLEP